MTKIFFPYNDQSKKLSFTVPDTIRFPFYLNDIEFYWELGTHGVTIYLLNNQIPNTAIIKDVFAEGAEITMHLVNEELDVRKHIFVEFAKIGFEIATLGLLDPLTLGDIDCITLGNISESYADWINMMTSVARADICQTAELSEIGMQLKGDSVLPYSKNVYVKDLSDSIGLIGLSKMGCATLGELDPNVLESIDAMSAAFRVFGNIPASLVKEIIIVHNKATMQNGVLSLDIVTEGA